MPFNLVVDWGIHQEDGMATGSYFLLLFCICHIMVSIILWCPSYYGIHHILSTPLLWSSGLSTGNQTVDWPGVLQHRLPSTSQVWTKLGWNHFLIDIAWRKYYSNAFVKHVCWNDRCLQCLAAYKHDKEKLHACMVCTYYICIWICEIQQVKS